MKKIYSMFLLLLTLLSASGQEICAELSDWKIFPWVKNGTAQIRKLDNKSSIITMTSSDKGAIHFFLDKEIKTVPEVKVTISYQWKGKNIVSGKTSNLSCGIYLHNQHGKYINKALSFSNQVIKTTPLDQWQNVTQSRLLPVKFDGKDIGFGKIFFSLTAGGNVEIRNFSAVVTPQ